MPNATVTTVAEPLVPLSTSERPPLAVARSRNATARSSASRSRGALSDVSTKVLSLVELRLHALHSHCAQVASSRGEVAWSSGEVAEVVERRNTCVMPRAFRCAGDHGTCAAKVSAESIHAKGSDKFPASKFMEHCSTTTRLEHNCHTRGRLSSSSPPGFFMSGKSLTAAAEAAELVEGTVVTSGGEAQGAGEPRAVALIEPLLEWNQQLQQE